jgi:hypothetical protein
MRNIVQIGNKRVKEQRLQRNRKMTVEVCEVDEAPPSLGLPSHAPTVEVMISHHYPDERYEPHWGSHNHSWKLSPGDKLLLIGDTLVLQNDAGEVIDATPLVGSFEIRVAVSVMSLIGHV